ncbi:hypothetical protein E2C01_025047 [Portunus trituberculatus]|uniref:Uncharacterized protein n=1 Tax=Portunus trituberculatus TaxID=210409 RepID=A0A5B7EC09_PORTR|nr:hypothetical protein [Portunus trituberculatus]
MFNPPPKADKAGNNAGGGANTGRHRDETGATQRQLSIDTVLAPELCQVCQCTVHGKHSLSEAMQPSPRQLRQGAAADIRACRVKYLGQLLHGLLDRRGQS